MPHHHITIDDSIYLQLAAKAALLHVSVDDLVAPALHRIAVDDPRDAEPREKRLTAEEWNAQREQWKRDAESRAHWYPENHTLDASREGIYDDRLKSLL